jgi:co-chaperonin GroES (HSP10)
MSERLKFGPPWSKKWEARMEHYKAMLPPQAALLDRVFIKPLDEADQPDTTAGGIVLAPQTLNKMGAQRGLIIDMGPVAVEQLYSMGVECGDIVITARFSRWERTYIAEDKTIHRVMICTASEITGSEDLQTKLANGDVWYEMNEDGDVEIAVKGEEEARKRNDPGRREYGV